MANLNESLYKGQVGVAVTLTAKEGKGDELFALCLAVKHQDNLGPSDPTDWILTRPNDNPDRVVAFEFFKDEAAKNAHYENNEDTTQETEAIMAILDEDMGSASRDDIHIFSSSTMTGRAANAGGNSPYYIGQPGAFLKFQAKEGHGQELFDITTELHYRGDNDDPVDWILAKKDDNPDILVGFEFYRDQESFDRHYSDTTVDENHDKIINMLGNLPSREDVTIMYTSFK